MQTLYTCKELLLRASWAVVEPRALRDTGASIEPRRHSPGPARDISHTPAHSKRVSWTRPERRAELKCSRSRRRRARWSNARKAPPGVVSQCFAAMPFDTDLSWSLAARRAGLSSSEGPAKAGTASTACRAHTTIYIRSTAYYSTVTAVGSLAQGGHHAAWVPPAAGRGGSIGTARQRNAVLPALAGEEEIFFFLLRCYVDITCCLAFVLAEEHPNGPAPLTGVGGATDGALPYAAAATAREAVMTFASKQCRRAWDRGEALETQTFAGELSYCSIPYLLPGAGSLEIQI